MPEYKSPINGQPLPRGKPFEQGEEQREKARKGGRASGRKRRQMRTLREELEMLLAETKLGPNGKKMTVQAGITASLVKKALSGDTRAFEIIRDTIGQKPVESVKINTPDAGVMDEIRKRMSGDDK